MKFLYRFEVAAARHTARRRMSAGRLLPILGLASAVGLYCGVEQRAAPPPSESRPQGLTVNLSDCMASSLISAIASANAAGSGQHQITLMGGCTYTLSTVNNYYYGPNALPVIEQNITIDGSSTGAVIERDAAGANMRLFYVARADLPPSKPGSLTLRNVTVQKGLAPGGGGGTSGGAVQRSSGGGMGAGGAIFAHGDLTLDRVLLTANKAQGGDTGNVVAGGAGVASSAGGGGMGGSGLAGGGGGGFQDAPTGGNGGSGVGTTEGGKVAVGMAGAGGSDASGTENGGNAASGQGGNGGGKRHLGGGGTATGTGTAGTAGDGGAGGASATLSGGGGAGFGGSGGNGSTGRGGGGGFGGGGATVAGGGVGGGGGNGSGGGAGGGGFGGGGGSSVSASGGQGGFGGGGGACPAGTGLMAGTSVFGGGSGAIGTVAATPVSGGGGGGMGGAVFVHLGQLTVVNSTLYANTAQGGLAGTATVKGGDGAGLGGAIFSLNGTVNITNSTLAGNKASSGGMGSGGALYVLSFGKKADGTTDETASATVHNSILGDSTDTATTPATTSDVAVNQAAGSAQLTVGADDVIEAAVFTVGGAMVTGTPTTADAKLDTLKNNGGPTQTLALLSGSPALSAGSLTVCSSAALGCVDQRGMYRSTACDVGAYEDAAPTTKPQACACAASAECQSGSCVDAFCCDMACGGGSPSDCQACANALTGMQNGTCGAILATASYTCRQADAGKPCDIAEVCNGGLTCPTDKGTTDTTIVCRSALAGVCDQADRCDGSSPNCTDTKKASGTLCRVKAAICDKAETCDGSSDSCPTDGVVMSADMQLCRAKSATNDCTKDSYCDGSGQLCRIAYQVPGTACRRFTSGAVTGCGGTCDAFGACRGPFTTPMGGACP